MAEIKSTLDLIMERTKNLTMTEEEKKAVQRKEWEGRIKGNVQKYIDGIVDIVDMKSYVETEESKLPELRQILREEILERIQPDGDNGKLLLVLEQVLDTAPGPIDNLIASFQKNIDTAKASREKSLKKELERKGISGSSVVPNLDCNEDWQELIQKLKSDFRNQLMSIKDN
jgi:uncharacterized protein YnzC (UPF0291/DUF896 family)